MGIRWGCATVGSGGDVVEVMGIRWGCATVGSGGDVQGMGC